MPNKIAAKVNRLQVHLATLANWKQTLPNWWEDRFDSAPEQIIDFLQGDGISLRGTTILDYGCGDGILSLGLLEKSGAKKVIGLEKVQVDIENLSSMASANKKDKFPDNHVLEFLISSGTDIPLPNSSIDVCVSWSVINFVDDLPALWSEFRRVLKPGGYMFIQIWPLFWSEHGTQLWPWMEDNFLQYKKSQNQIFETIDASIKNKNLSESVKEQFLSSSRVTIDEIQRSMHEAGITIAKAELLSSAFHLDEFTQNIPLSKQGISGVKLLAVSN